MDSHKRSDLKKLSDLLNLGLQFEENYDSKDSAANNLNPQDLIDCAIDHRNHEKNEKYLVKSALKNIWDDDEIEDEEADEARNKLKPEYEIVYQQSVTPDDIFLQMSEKDMGTHSCESLLIKIKLPGTKSVDEICMNTSSMKLKCITKKFYLNLDLPKEIDPVNSTAKWNAEDEILTAQLLVDTKCNVNI